MHITYRFITYSHVGINIKEIAEMFALQLGICSNKITTAIQYATNVCTALGFTFDEHSFYGLYATDSKEKARRMCVILSSAQQIVTLYDAVPELAPSYFGKWFIPINVTKTYSYRPELINYLRKTSTRYDYSTTPEGHLCISKLEDV